jgi:hypothetical protein
MITAIRVTMVYRDRQEAGEDARLGEHGQLLGLRDGMGVRVRDTPSIAGLTLKISKKWCRTIAASVHASHGGHRALVNGGSRNHPQDVTRSSSARWSHTAAPCADEDCAHEVGPYAWLIFQGRAPRLPRNHATGGAACRRAGPRLRWGVPMRQPRKAPRKVAAR